MAIFKEFLYICDWNNHCVIIVNKTNGIYQTEYGKEGRRMGEFYHPQCIFIWNEIWYIGDFYSIQLYNFENLCLERIESWKNEKFDRIHSICIVQNYLFVSDNMTNRIRAFE